jgi:flagellar biosynthesis component FlhA
MDVILQTLAEHGGKVSERGLLAEVRVALAPVVSESVAQGRAINGVVVDPLLDFVLARAEESNSLVSGELVELVCDKARDACETGQALVVSKRCRAYLRDLVRVRGNSIPVIAREEIAPRFELRTAGEISFAEDRERALLIAAVEGDEEHDSVAGASWRRASMA